MRWSLLGWRIVTIAPGTELWPVGRQEAMLSIVGLPGTAEGFKIPHLSSVQNSGPAPASGLRRSHAAMGGRAVLNSSTKFFPSGLPNSALRLRGMMPMECGRPASPSCLPLLTSDTAPLPIPRPCVLVMNGPGEVPAPTLGASWWLFLGSFSWSGALLCCWNNFGRNSDVHFSLGEQLVLSLT